MKDIELERLRKSMEQVVNDYNKLKSSGVNPELLELFIHDRTKLSKRAVKQMIEAQDEFYTKLVNKVMVDKT